MKTDDSRFYKLVNCLITKKATKAEKEELQKLVNSNSEYNLLYHLFVNEDSGSGEEVSDQALKAFEKHKTRMTDLGHFTNQGNSKNSVPGTIRMTKLKTYSSKKYTRQINFSIAASILFILGFVYFQQYGFNYPLFTKQYHITTLNGERKSFYLPDGTHVWLNGGSKLSYNEYFNKHDRPVTLTGEAFFDVTKNAKKPFLIQAGETSVKVLGTSFNLRAYPDEKKVETTLLEGKIEMALNNSSSKKIQIKPGQKLSIDYNLPVNKEKVSDKKRQTVLLSNATVDKKDSIAMDALWLQDILVFDAEPLSKVAFKLEKWYNVKVEIQTEDLRDLNFSGAFKQKTIENVLDALQATGSFKYKIQANTIYIK